MAEEKQDVETLKRRGRRRLVGAVALVLAAVIVLPMVFDQEPRSTGSALSTRIPGEDETPFKPKPPARKAEPAKKAEPVAKTEPVPEKAAATPPKEEYVVQVGAFTNPQGAIAKLKSAKLPYYTEALKDNRTGNLTRVHAGPFATREAAEKAVEQLKALGFRPGGVSSKSG